MRNKVTVTCMNNTSKYLMFLSLQYLQIMVANALTSVVHCMEPRKTLYMIRGHVKKHVVAGTSDDKDTLECSCERVELSGGCVTTIVYL